MARFVGPTGWTTARLVSAVIGALLALGSLGFLAAGGVALWASTTQRHGGDIDLGTWSYRSTGYAVTSSATEMFGAAGSWEVMRSLFGTVRIRVTSSAGPGPVFVGIAPADAASHYLSGIRYDTVQGIAHHHVGYVGHRGGAPVTVPGLAGIWAVQAAGPGTQTLAWPASDAGMAVVMNVTGSRPVAVRINVAASLPALPWIGAGLLIGGSLLLVAAVVLIAVPARRPARVTPRSPGRDH